MNAIDEERRFSELARDRRRVHRLMVEERLCSVMNETKWRELCMAFYAMGCPPEFRIRDLLAKPGAVPRWDSEWFYHPRPYVTIEWMELRPWRGGDVGPTLEVLRRAGATFEIDGDVVKVFGYTRPSQEVGKRITAEA